MPSPSAPLLTRAFAATAGVLMIAVAYHIYTYRAINDEKAGSVDESDLDNDYNMPDSSVVPLPPHVERELRKQQRWRRLIPKLIKKQPMYDNIVMKDPDGYVLSTVSEKKAKWYVNKQLAVWEEENVCIRLSFVPNKAKTYAAAGYNATMKDNRCVICGLDQDYMRFSIVPHAYRSLFPTRFKTHLPHDIVLLCATCHVEASQLASRRKRELEHRYPDIAKYIQDTNATHVKQAGSTLLRRKHQLPLKRIAELEGIVRDYFHLSKTSAITADHLQTTSQLENHRITNPRYQSRAELLISDLLSKNEPEQALTHFIKGWRHWFLTSLRPKFLPNGWHLDHPVQCDKTIIDQPK